jgi:3' terminal RNA ribose 2'-O-methyltransferase Hen1
MMLELQEARIDAVRRVVRERGARSVLDLGCGDGDFLIRLVGEPQVERIVGVDLCRDALERLRVRLDSVAKGRTGPRVDLIYGSMIENGASLRGFDCAVLLETIEHIDPGRLSLVEREVFVVMRPATVVITTPNAELNPLLGVPSHRFRHPDHRFEWGRAKFRAWAEGIARRHHYDLVCSDIAGQHPVYGGASQMAVFEEADRRKLVR